MNICKIEIADEDCKDTGVEEVGDFANSYERKCICKVETENEYDANDEL